MDATYYREMARDCLQEAEMTKDPAHRKSLLDVAKLYNQTALAMEAAAQAPVAAAAIA